MTLDEIKKRRADLNAEITRLVGDFEQATGCAVTEIHTDRVLQLVVGGPCQSVLSRVRVSIELE